MKDKILSLIRENNGIIFIVLILIVIFSTWAHHVTVMVITLGLLALLLLDSSDDEDDLDICDSGEHEFEQDIQINVVRCKKCGEEGRLKGTTNLFDK